MLLLEFNLAYLRLNIRRGFVVVGRLSASNRQIMKGSYDMKSIAQNEILNLEVLESRLEMESVATVVAPCAAPNIPISECRYDF